MKGSNCVDAKSTTLSEHNLYELAEKLADALSTAPEWTLVASDDIYIRHFLHTKLDQEIDRIGRIQEKIKNNDCQ